MKEMKKYAAPAMKVISVNVESMIAESGDNPVPPFHPTPATSHDRSDLLDDWDF